jgi:hypothetical protein
MNDKTQNPAAVTPEQVRYADWIFYGSWLAIAILFVTYGLYVSGAVAPQIPVEQITELWSLPVDEYVHEADIPIGWGWVSLLGKGDFLNFLGVALLAAMSIVCFLGVLLPAYIKQQDWIYVGIVVLEVLVLCLAASGILGGGGH